MPRTISSLGSVALLVSSITGPSLVVIPLLFQQAGWLTPLLTFAVVALLSGAAALFIVEVMSSIEGNETFQASIEFTTIAHLFLAMQTLVIASLLESFQTMDAFLVGVAHKTCAISFKHGWVCVSKIPPNAGAFTGYILGSFGTLITISLILPLSLVHLVDNIIFQIASFVILLVITVVWIVIFSVSGLNVNKIPVVGHNQSSVVGFVLSNFSFVTTIPAWVNNTHPSVDVRYVVWLSILISCLIYIPIGWMGGSAFVLPNNTTLLQVLSMDTGHGALSRIAQVSSYVFPLAVLITSIPVFTIVIRYNLLRGNICSYKMAIFLSAIVPWLVAIPFQTNGGITTILNWASLIFTSPSNLLVPFILYIVSKRHLASAVLDANVSPAIPRTLELETLLTPVGMTSAPERETPVENIRIVIITDSTDSDPGNTDEVKALASPRETEGSTLDVIPMPVKNRVSSPSRHRYYGREFLNEGGECSTNTGKVDPTAENPEQQRPSLSLSLSHSHSITHSSNSGMDEFLLLSPASESPSHTVRGVLSAHSPRASWSSIRSSGTLEAPDERRPGTDSEPPRDAGVRPSIQIPTVVVEEPGLTFKAFPRLSPTSLIRPTRISVIGFSLATTLVLTAIVYNIVESVHGGSGS